MHKILQISTIKPEKLSSNLVETLNNFGTNDTIASTLIIVAIIIVAFIANYITKRVIISVLTQIIKKTKTEYDDIFLEKKVFNLLSHIVPAVIIYYAIPLAFNMNPQATSPADISLYQSIINHTQSAMYVYMIIVVLLVFNSFINALHEIYLKQPVSKNLTIKGYLQVIKIIIVGIGIILMLAALLGKKPGALFAGLGALAAVLMLIFKDTILGFVAGIQLSAYNMLKPGDWISMPSRNTDGTVLDISLNTVKVQNWNKTISTIPTYALVSESFSNWRGMSESGGRRIKRAVTLDMQSVGFLTKEMTEKLKKVRLLKDYLEEKEKKIKEHNKKYAPDDSSLINGRHLTNLGTFRKYVEAYLRENPNINMNLTFLVRQLPPSEKGIPIEIYVFSKDQRWTYYEGIQADIFDHLLAIIPEFGLRVFQNPTGNDFKSLLNIQ